ncbi:MAG: hypothetical protein ACR5K4_02990 [Sodalis sp. (in: enterobacteria)]
MQLKLSQKLTMTIQLQQIICLFYFSPLNSSIKFKKYWRI